MPLTVGDFYDDLRAIIARGTSQNARLPTLCRQAVRFFERNNSFDYMRDTFFLIPNPEENFFDLDEDSIPTLKAVEALAYYGANGGSLYLEKMNKLSLGPNNGNMASQYYLKGRRLYLLGAPRTSILAYPMLLSSSSYSTWPTDEDETHPLLDMADDLIKWQVQLALSIGFRSQEELQGIKLMRDEALKTVLDAQEEADRESNAQMLYFGGSDGRLFASSLEAIEYIQGIYDLPETFGVAGIYHAGVP